MARSYLPSKVSEIVAIWKNDLNKVPSFSISQTVIYGFMQWVPEIACWFRKLKYFVLLYLIYELVCAGFLNLLQFVFLIVVIIISLKVNQKAAESLADPQEYPNLFEDWQVALAIESNLGHDRCLLT